MMKESAFGFQYTWDDLKPLRALVFAVLGTQVLGLVIGVAFPRFPSWFDSLWFGGAVATFPGFLIGLAVQSQLTPGRLAENRTMVRRFGLVAALVTAVAIGAALWGFGAWS